MRCLHWTPCNHQRSGVRFTVASRAVLECLQSIAALWPTDSASMILAACNCTLPTAGPPVQQRGRAGSRGRAASARAHATALLRRPPAAALQTGHRMAARASHFSTCGRATRTNPADACCTLACVEQRACWQVWWELCTGCNLSSRPGWWQAGCRQVTRKSNGAIAPISEVWQERAMMVSCSGTQCAQMGCRCGLRTHLTALRPTGRHKPPKRGPRATLWTLCTKLAPEVRAPFRQTATVTLDM